jgi:hypothetical protein
MPVVVVVEVAAVPPGSYSQEIITPNDNKTKMVTLWCGRVSIGRLSQSKPVNPYHYAEGDTS